MGNTTAPGNRPVSGPGWMPAENPTPTRQQAFYIILTTQTPTSGTVFGGISAIAAAEQARLVDGPGAPGAFVAAYTRLVDALVPVDVETTLLSGPAAVRRYRVRTWLGQQLLSQHEMEWLA
ncbi:hypothetical protein ACIBMZ_26530 [Micromonospora sp. NPDC049900]|uniref:hypothetical protein n=1 Tax=Micromonospora sp. NPDC049900 TaxID=3364275 RepID=UPI0037ACA8EC